MTATPLDGLIVLTGNVFVQGALVENFRALTAEGKTAQSGDLRLHAHLDDLGRDRRERQHRRAGYSGYIRASVFDGSSWRQFMLALELPPEARQFSQVAQRALLAERAIVQLRKLAGLTCRYRKSGFAVDRSFPPQTTAPAVPAVTTKPVQGELF